MPKASGPSNESGGHLRPVVVDDEVTFIEVGSRDDADAAQTILSVQWDYVHGWLPASALDDLPDTIAGRRVVKDPRVLDDLARQGEFEIDSLYRELFG